MPEGLMSKAQNQAQQMPADPMAGGMAEEESESVTDGEQESYESAMAMVGQMLYKNKKISDKIIQMVRPEQPAQGIADASAFLLGKIEEAFEGEYPEDLVVNTADQISDLVMELAEASGSEITDEVATKAKGLLTKQIVDAYGVDPAAFEQATQDVTKDDIAEYEQMFGGE